MKTKLCRKHNNGNGAELPISAFYPIKKGGTRLQPYCKECIRGNVVQWQRDNREKHKAKQNRWELAHPERVRESNRISAAKRRAENPAKFKAYNFKRDLMRFYG